MINEDFKQKRFRRITAVVSVKDSQYEENEIIDRLLNWKNKDQAGIFIVPAYGNDGDDTIEPYRHLHILIDSKEPFMVGTFQNKVGTNAHINNIVTTPKNWFSYVTDGHEHQEALIDNGAEKPTNNISNTDAELYKNISLILIEGSMSYQQILEHYFDKNPDFFIKYQEKFINLIKHNSLLRTPTGLDNFNTLKNECF